MNTLLKVLVAVSLVVILASGGFVGGYAFARFSPSAMLMPAVGAEEDTALTDDVNEAFDILKAEALEPPSETSATAGALQGLLESGGDQYGAYFDPKHFEYFNQEMSGEFGGIGVTLGEQDGTTYVVEVFEGTPAEGGGLKSGDRFVVIDDVRRDRWTSDEVVKRVRGEEGTPVKLTMLRPGKKGTPGKEFSVELTRDVITFPNTKSELKGDVGYIRLAQFNDNATGEISEAIRELTKKGAKSFVLDLRNNPGGALQQAVNVSSLFIDDGVIVRVDERGKPETEYRAVGKTITDAPLVVLVNGNSASASEIVGGALQDYDRAILVGEQSFGKGSVQTIKRLSTGGAMKFTTAHYLTPKSRVINKKGLTPDVVVKMDIEDEMDPEKDAQLKRALVEAKKLAK
ncbi:MAG: S41 family peptidase [Coriobacteriia bacterium]|nr:S41 family peptidase [Coriobacteriia bacterium]